VAVLTGNATGLAALRRAPPADLPERVELGAVPFIAQTPLHCGPASLAMVLRHIGRDASAEQLADAVFLPARGGTLQAEMLAGARRHDALAQRIPGRLEALLHELQAGHPVVVLQNLGLTIAPTWHYAVLIGYDAKRNVALLRSGADERLEMRWQRFAGTWHRGGRWAFTTLEPGVIPMHANAARYVEAAAGLEAAGKLRAIETAGLHSYPRIAPPPELPPPTGLDGVTIDLLRQMVEIALTREIEHHEPVHVIRPHKITVREKVEMLVSRLEAEGKVSFRSVIEACRSRMEIIVSFMAVLELIKSRVLDAVQDGTFTDILLVPSGEDAVEVGDTSEFDAQA